MFTAFILIMFFAMVMTLYRFIKGPSFSDRVLAFDVLGIMSVSLLLILSLYFQRMIYLDVALVIGLIGFLGSTISGRYLEKGI